MVYSKKVMAVSPSATLSIDAKARKLKAEGKKVISFAVGEPDFDTPVHIKQAAIEAINNGFTKYTPAVGIMDLRQAVCGKLLNDNGLKYTPEQIIISNGAKHSLNNAFKAILNQGDEVLLSSPYWVSYPEMIRLADGEVKFIETKGENKFKFSVKQLEKSLTAKTKALVLNNPNNPTGAMYNKSELEEIARFAVKNEIIVISDEIYEELVYDGERYISIASFNDDIKNLTIVVNGVSKAYAMTGWRIGYTASNSDIVKIMANLQSQETSNANSIAQKAALEALKGSKESIELMRNEYLKRRDYILASIDSIKQISCIRPSGAFYIMINIEKCIGKIFKGKKILNADMFAELLLENKYVALVPGTGFGIEGYMRLSYATSMDNIVEGLNRIEAFINEIQ